MYSCGRFQSCTVILYLFIIELKKYKGTITKSLPSGICWEPKQLVQTMSSGERELTGGCRIWDVSVEQWGQIWVLISCLELARCNEWEGCFPAGEELQQRVCGVNGGVG